MGWLRKKYEQAKSDVKDELKHRAEVRKVQKESYRTAQVREAKKLGVKKAEYESTQKLKAMKEKKPGYTFGGFAGPTSKRPTPSVGVADYLLNSSQKGSKSVSGPSLSSALTGGGGSKRKGKSINQELRGFGL